MYSQLNHFDYAKLDRECGCAICTPWRQARQTYGEMLAKIDTHPRDCMCDLCREGYKARSEYLVHLNRRDLYCESSFHASVEPGLGAPYMDWLSKQMNDKAAKPDGWWEIQAPALPMQSWFRRFQHAVSIAASGVTNGVTMAVSGMSRVATAA